MAVKKDDTPAAAVATPVPAPATRNQPRPSTPAADDRQETAPAVDGLSTATTHTDETDRDARVAELERENAELRRQLADAHRSGGLFTTDAAPKRPYFNEAMREELERQGWTVDPTTGQKLTEDPRDQVIDTEN